MNKNIRNYLNCIFLIINETADNIVSSIISLCRMFVLSKMSVARKSKKNSQQKRYNNCTILANGPSLKEALESKEVLLEGNDVFVVNMFVQTTDFWKIKPRFYFIVDGAFFTPKNERHEELISVLLDAFQKVDWDMNLCISAGCANGGILKLLDNPHIKIMRWNTTTFEGFPWLRHFMFRHNMAMPRCQTITNMALVAAINMGYKNINLYGADHSWTKDLRVDDDNIVCYGDRHVYNANLIVIKKEKSFAYLLRQFAKMFESHEVISLYAKRQNCKILNCTKGSFIDAYERKKNVS